MRRWLFLMLAVAMTASACLRPLPKGDHTTSPAGARSGTAEENIAPEPIGGLAGLQAAVHQPEEVWKENRSGMAVVAATISSSGRVLETHIVKSSGSAALDAEAMLAVARAAWKPGRRNGVPVTATVEVQLHFGQGY
ncbi:MAG: energy transducer TonB [candidate division KSB1 bacterium]|nr:energy transducer TonB [candidate division KSB1 bacterium]MDZ7275087.1 energy transducer TonB [candidate division KSB1 bacterium]MDZ7286465.1 energy transducer TonB [candidate division KSB1 bacterium]MDZ7299371.1 energy transducer TonB [candidate division KSB1 bacterium]MDZ7306300.1 energy transducer TonB [candidate division KSB1 bacterium]